MFCGAGNRKESNVFKQSDDTLILVRYCQSKSNKNVSKVNGSAKNDDSELSAKMLTVSGMMCNIMYTIHNIYILIT